MKVRAQALAVAELCKPVLSDDPRFERSQADTLHSVYGIKPFDKSGKSLASLSDKSIRTLLCDSVGRKMYPGQHDLVTALSDRSQNLPLNLIRRSGSKLSPAPHKRYQTVRTKLIASVLYLYKCSGPALTMKLSGHTIISVAYPYRAGLCRHGIIMRRNR